MLYVIFCELIYHFFKTGNILLMKEERKVHSRFLHENNLNFQNFQQEEGEMTLVKWVGVK